MQLCDEIVSSTSPQPSPHHTRRTPICLLGLRVRSRAAASESAHREQYQRSIDCDRPWKAFAGVELWGSTAGSWGRRWSMYRDGEGLMFQRGREAGSHPCDYARRMPSTRPHSVAVSRL